MIDALLFMLALGGACGLLLSAASRIFYVYEDPRIGEVEGALAGANCGGCGFAGCSAAASAVVAGQASANVCIVGGSESAQKVAAVMGMSAEDTEAGVSFNQCTGGDRAADRYIYSGVGSCRAMASFYGGKRECRIGCLGFGDCVRVCVFNAIKMGPDGYPVIDGEKCVGCGACEAACPKGVLSVKTLSSRLLEFNESDNCLAPCRQTCPAQINIPEYIDRIRKGDYQGAVQTIRERNPLLLACGRVCPHPCETSCRRGLEDEPVSINQLKRFAADYEMKSGRRFTISKLPDTGKRVAVIGGGPAGLSCAYFLRRLGHGVTIFEAMPKLGGMIRYGIPEYRLPKKVLDWEITGILNLGIAAHTDMRFGTDFDLPGLVAAGYDAIFFGVGAWKDMTMRVPGEEGTGVYTGIKFLADMALFQAGKGPRPFIGANPVVVGGGNTAIDCVRTLIRAGAASVTLAYRRTRKEMPANNVEIVAAEHEGCRFVFLAAPTKVVRGEDGKMKGLEYQRMELGEPDASGRRRPVPVQGSETLLETDMVVSAIGQRPDVSFMQKAEKRLKDLAITKYDTIENNPLTLQTSIPYIFVAGDSATGPDLVVSAIGGGRRAARSIHQYLTGQPVTPASREHNKGLLPESKLTKIIGIVKKPRQPMPEMPVDERIKTFEEVDQVISEEDALTETQRCLRCGVICYNPDITAVNDKA